MPKIGCSGDPLYEHDVHGASIACDQDPQCVDKSIEWGIQPDGPITKQVVLGDIIKVLTVVNVLQLGGDPLTDGGEAVLGAVARHEEEQVAEDAAGGAVESQADELPTQIHHFATNKNSVYTPQMEKIAERYGLDLDGSWNKEAMSHLGRHPNAYHEFVLDGMRTAAREAGDDKEKFLELFDQYVKDPIRENPQLLRKAGWQ